MGTASAAREDGSKTTARRPCPCCVCPVPNENPHSLSLVDPPPGRGRRDVTDSLRSHCHRRCPARPRSADFSCSCLRSLCLRGCPGFAQVPPRDVPPLRFRRAGRTKTISLWNRQRKLRNCIQRGYAPRTKRGVSSLVTVWLLKRDRLSTPASAHAHLCTHDRLPTRTRTLVLT